MTLRKHRFKLFFALLALVFTTIAQAHSLKVFAYVEGDTVHGHVYYAGGKAATRASVLLIDDAAQILDSVTPDNKGEFSFTLSKPGKVTVVADTGDGHKATWDLEYVAAPTQAKPETNTAESQQKASQSNPTPSGGIEIATAQTTLPTKPSPSSSLTNEQLVTLIEQAVAKQIGPLRQDLEEAQSRAKFADIVGGIGFIFGIYGLVMWLRHRK